MLISIECTESEESSLLLAFHSLRLLFSASFVRLFSLARFLASLHLHQTTTNFVERNEVALAFY
jgi:hypothetical protein